jgi:hypothetical protein
MYVELDFPLKPGSEVRILIEKAKNTTSPQSSQAKNHLIKPLQAPSGWQLNRAKGRAVHQEAIRVAFPYLTHNPFYTALKLRINSLLSD